jgi:hypothetical protein
MNTMWPWLLREPQCHWRRRLVRRQAHSGSSSRILLGTTRSDQTAQRHPSLATRARVSAWLHDAGSGTLAQNAKFATAFNFGPSDEDIWPVERMATKLVQMWGDGACWTRDSVPSVHEDQVLRLDASKARVELGWQPRLKIDAALEWTMGWYRAWNRGVNMAEFTQKQIAECEDLLRR